MHSVKNRFLMRMKNITPDLYRRHWLAITARDLVVIGCCALREWSSLKAYWLVLKNWSKVMEKRHWIMARKRASDEYMASWFHFQPVARPASKQTVRGAKQLAARAVRG